ncbi:hypothetical protein [Methylobacterium sp. E-066]|uniref:hypothetical protein n=1 Tax=Methylobacterium sp. E-066 TaxID=2836584 RepID=UPI001FBAD484|nr:hypothetical protein [Methylobacterium sp. E-066]
MTDVRGLNHAALEARSVGLGVMEPIFLRDTAIAIGRRSTIDDVDVRMRVQVADEARKKVECGRTGTA